MIYSQLWEDRLQMDASSVPVGKMGELGTHRGRQTVSSTRHGWRGINFLELPNRR